MEENRCVACGSIIPEGRQVCPKCEELFFAEPKPIKLGNTNKSGKCGMCGVSVKKLYPHKVGKVDFMICERCKDIMDL